MRRDGKVKYSLNILISTRLQCIYSFKYIHPSSAQGQWVTGANQAGYAQRESHQLIFALRADVWTPGDQSYLEFVSECE